MKIIIDTNIYLDFYRSKKDSLIIFSTLTDNASSIVLTDQVINEFYRNRERTIRHVKTLFEKESKIENIASSFLSSLTEYEVFIATHQRYQSDRAKVISRIQEIILDITKDPVANEFKLFADKKFMDNTLLFTSENSISKAQRRNLEGNPPNSDKFSIGDEINWEIILENVTDDLVIVGRDKTYTDNFNYLRHEFHKKTGKFIHKLTDRISEAFHIIGLDQRAIAEIEERQIQELGLFAEYWKHQQ